MSVSLSSLVERLQRAVPARNDVPNLAQYTQAVKDAAADFSRRSAMRKMALISVVAGSASYALPSDFTKLISFSSSTSSNGVIIGNEGLIPVEQGFAEQYTIAGKTLTIIPTPAYSMTRELWYMAGHVLDINSDYPDLTDDDASILLNKAEAIALSWQANVAAQAAWQYQIGDERVNKERVVEALRAMAQAADQRYVLAIGTQSSRPYGTRAKYSEVDY